MKKYMLVTFLCAFMVGSFQASDRQPMLAQINPSDQLFDVKKTAVSGVLLALISNARAEQKPEVASYVGQCLMGNRWEFFFECFNTPEYRRLLCSMSPEHVDDYFVQSLSVANEVEQRAHADNRHDVCELVGRHTRVVSYCLQGFRDLFPR